LGLEAPLTLRAATWGKFLMAKPANLSDVRP
jgi:hypothetical protein